MSSEICEEYLKPNKSKTYLLPLFVDVLNLKYLEYIENTFLQVDGITEEPIFSILYRYSDKIEYHVEGDGGFMYYAEAVKKSEYFLKSFELGDYSLFVFKLPEQLNYAYGCLVEGKYSWLTPEEKQMIIKFINKQYPDEKNIITQIIGILNRSKILRKTYEQTLNMPLPKDIELSSKICMKSETINPILA